MKMKKLLAAALAATMVVSSMVSSFVASAATLTGTITAGSVEVTAGATEVTVPVTIAFTNEGGVESPHGMFTVKIADASLTKVELVSPIINAKDANGDDVLVDGQPVRLLNVESDGVNLTTGTVIVESATDSKAPTVTEEIVVNCTFTIPAAQAGTIAVDISDIQATNLSEDDWTGMTAVSGSIVVAEAHVCAPGAYTDNGDGTHDIACSGCDQLYADNEAHIYVDGTCACGATEAVACEHEWEVVSAIPATTETTGTLELGCTKCDVTETNTVTYNRYARANNRSLVLEAAICIAAEVYDRDLVRCNEAAADGVCSEYIVQFVEDREGVDPFYAYSADAKPMTDPSNGRTYGLLTYGLRSVDMVNDVTMTVFAKVDGQWVTGEVYSDSIQSLSNVALGSAATPTATKTLIVDMLNYGIAAQINFGVNTSNLPSVAGYESFASTGDVSYADNSSWAPSSTETAPFTTTGIALELSSKILLRPNLQFGNKYYANYADKYDGMKIVVAYTNFKGKEIEQEYVNITVDPEGDYVFESTDGVRKFGLSVDIFTPADLRQTYTIKAYTADGTLLNTDIISSVESSAYSIRATAVSSGNTNLVNLLDAMMRYGDSANAAFS